MRNLSGNIFLLILIVELILLSIQAEPVTGTFGFIISGILSAAFVLSLRKVK